MPDEMTDAVQGHNDGQSRIPSAPSPQETIAIKKILPSKLSSGPPETWVPYYIHTAKCDRCGQHNTSVVQRSSRENKQFCKACMHLNVRDGLYSVIVAGLDWDHRISSVKRRTQGTGKLQKPQQLRKPGKHPISTRISKRKQKEPKGISKKTVKFADHSRPEIPDDVQFVPTDDTGYEGDETDEDVSKSRLPCLELLSSERKSISTVRSKDRDSALRSAIGPDEMEQGQGNNRKPEGHRPQYVCDNGPKIRWWERTQITESDTRDGNIQSSLMPHQGSEVSPDVLQAATILLKMKQGVR